MAEIKEGKPVQSYYEANVSASVEVLVDTLDITKFKAIEWLFAIEDNTNNKFRSGKINASHLQSVNPDYSIHSLNGDSILHSYRLILDAGNIKLYFTNNESNTVKVKVGRLSI